MKHSLKHSLVWRILGISLALVSCSDVQLTYGLGGSGLTTVADRNRNASTPTSLEELNGRRISPTPSSTPLGERDGARNPQTVASPIVTTSAIPSSDSRYEGVLKLKLLPEGPIYLLGRGDQEGFDVILEDSSGKRLDPAQFGGLVYETANGELIEVNNQSITALVNKGQTSFTVYLKDSPEIRTQVTVYIGTDSSGVSSNNGNYQLKILPSGPILLDGFGDFQNIQILLETLQGQAVDISQHPLIWELADESQASIDGNRVISRVEEGSTTLKISLQEDPDTWVLIDVIIGGDTTSGGGGGGSGGNNGNDNEEPPTPVDNVTGVVIFE